MKVWIFVFKKEIKEEKELKKTRGQEDKKTRRQEDKKTRKQEDKRTRKQEDKKTRVHAGNNNLEATIVHYAL